MKAMKETVLVVVLALAGCGELEEMAGANGNSDLRPEEKATFQWIQANILKSSCVRCHSGGEPPAGVSLESYRGIMDNAPGIIVTGDPEASEIYLQIRSGNMPRKGPKLSDEQIEAVRQWILNGSLDN